MNMWDRVAEVNALRAKLGEPLWHYIGDAQIVHSGMAICVDEKFGYASFVAVTDLGNAGANGAYSLETGTVILDNALRLNKRKQLREALEAIGQTMAGIVARYPNDPWKRKAELAYALLVYGARDIDSETILIRDREAFDEAHDGFRFPDWAENGEDCASVTTAFIEALHA